MLVIRNTPFMKKLLIICLLLTALQGFSQSIKATYTSTIIIESNEEIIGYPPSEVFAYEYDQGKSLTTMISGPTTIPDLKLSPSVFYKDLIKGIYKWKLLIGGKNYSIKDKLKSLDWEITTETKDINGYLCTKATCVINDAPVIAWFCPTINISDGPLFYSGLPGFIIKLTQANVSEYIASDLQISNQPSLIKEPIQKKEINFKKFKKLLSKDIERITEK